MDKPIHLRSHTSASSNFSPPETLASMPTTTPPPAAPSLPGELLEEIFLRFPPDEPSFLMRASLASKLWFVLLTGPNFQSRYREFHGSPPMLGFFCNQIDGSDLEEEEKPVSHFVPTTKFDSCISKEDWIETDYDVWDCRHGHVLFGQKGRRSTEFIVRNPMTACWTEVHTPKRYMGGDNRGAAVFCAMTGCDHRPCHESPFRMAFVCLYLGVGEEDDDSIVYAGVSLPQMCNWSNSCSKFLSKPCSELWSKRWSNSSGLHVPSGAWIDSVPPVLIEDSLYFMISYYDGACIEVLKYDLSSNCLSLIDGLPVEDVFADATRLIAMEDTNLGLAHVDRLTLYLWSRQMGYNGVPSWTQRIVIDLNNLLPVRNPNRRLKLIGSVEGSDIIFVTIDFGIYEINLKSLRWKTITKTESLCALIPYMSFYIPKEMEERPATQMRLTDDVGLNMGLPLGRWR
uniref:F-box domain-containing protein n=2 Tax=Aegilops tauschii subsp. strangulata TaxID=200361 RepID=A0A453MIS2_AEGTS